MATQALDPIDDSVREVSDEEVAHYQRNGWALLPGLVDTDVVDTLIARLKSRMGEEAEIDMIPEGEKTPRPPTAKKIFTFYDEPAKDDAFIHDFTRSQGLGRMFARMNGAPVRAWNNVCYVKMPVGREGGKTPWHQDWPYYPFDRMGSATVWIALMDIPAEMGTMRFVNGSHLWGPQGRIIHRTDGLDTLDIMPDYLKEKVQISPPLNLKKGDATIHNDMTIHSAPVNATDSPRWVFSVVTFPADALYTGAPHRFLEDITLPINQPLDHPKFPILPS